MAPLALIAFALPSVVVRTAGGSSAAYATGAGSARTITARSGAALTPALAHRLSEDVTDRVIVVLRRTATATPTSVAAQAAAVERPVVTDLRATGSHDVEGLSLVDDVVATVSPGEAARLRADPAVAEVVPDRIVRMASPTPAVRARARGAASANGFAAPAKSCPSAGGVQLDPEAIEVIHAADQSGRGHTAQALGYTGAGVKVGFIADGLNPDNPDLIRADGRHVVVGYQDFSNSGSGGVTDGGEAFLDASSVAAQGRQVYNLEDYGTGLDRPCDIRILGVAPGANLVDLDTFGSSDSNFTSAILEAIDYATTTSHVNVLNESFGDDPFPDVASLDLVEQADSAAVAHGVTVTVSSGDEGPTDTIGSPASDPDVISAGASTTYRSYLQSGIGDTFGGPVRTTGWDSDNVSPFSSGGVSEAGRTIDVLAPGDLNWALCSPHPAIYQDCTNFAGRGASVQLTGGTSESAPLTAGTAALVIQAYREAHRGSSPTPAVIKEIITSTAEDVQAPGDLQGAGMIDAYAAVLAARSYSGSTVAPVGHAVLVSSDQLDAAGEPSSAESLHETVRNDGSGTASLQLSTRILRPYSVLRAVTLQVTKAKHDRSVVHFTVPAGQARLDSQIAYPATTANDGTVNLSLFGPVGTFAANDSPAFSGNHADVEVAHPAAGRWTAVIDVSAATTVHFAAQTATWEQFGTVAPSAISLAPGASKAITVDVDTPAAPGEEAGSVVIASGAKAPRFTTTTTVPIVLRSYASTPAPTTTFTGTLLGSDEGSSDVGQGAYYQVSLPAGEAALGAEITTGDARNTFTAQLVSPSGLAASAAANSLLTGTAGGPSRLQGERGTQLHVLDPVAGIWTLAINFFGETSGTAVSHTFTVSLSTTAPEVSAGGLPDASGTTLPAGRATTVGVEVTNTGTTPEAYFVDARLAASQTVQLAPRTTALAVLPPSGDTTPTYLVPSATSSVQASVTAKEPALFDFAYIFGDPDLIAGAAARTDHPTGSFTPGAAGVPSGVWGIDPYLDGPDGVKGYPRTVVRTAMTATTREWDTTVSAPTGDLWKAAVDPDAGIDPYLVGPGQTVTIPVTITPKAPAGTIVRGTLFVDDDTAITASAGSLISPASGVLPDGSELAALPYEYTVAEDCQC